MQVSVPIKRARRVSFTTKTSPIRRQVSDPEPINVSQVEAQTPLLKSLKNTPTLNNSGSLSKVPIQNCVNGSQNIVLPIKPSKFVLQSIRYTDKGMKKSLDSVYECDKSDSTIRYNSQLGDEERPKTPSLKIKKTCIRKTSQNSMLNLKKTNSSIETSTNVCSIEKINDIDGNNFVTAIVNKNKAEIGELLFETDKNFGYNKKNSDKIVHFKGENSNVIEIKECRPNVIPVKRTTLRHKSANRNAK